MPTMNSGNCLFTSTGQVVLKFLGKPLGTADIYHRRLSFRSIRCASFRSSEVESSSLLWWNSREFYRADLVVESAMTDQISPRNSCINSSRLIASTSTTSLGHDPGQSLSEIPIRTGAVWNHFFLLHNQGGVGALSTHSPALACLAWASSPTQSRQKSLVQYWR